MPFAPKGKDRFSTTICSGAAVGRNPAPAFSACKAQKKSWDIYHIKWCKISYSNNMSDLGVVITPARYVYLQGHLYTGL